MKNILKEYKLADMKASLSAIRSNRKAGIHFLPELAIGYEAEQKDFYFAEDKRCLYEQWSKPWGIHATGKNFPVMVAKGGLTDRGYDVYISGDKTNSYALLRYRKKRISFEGYHLLCNVFGENRINEMIAEAEYMGLSGGDPDIFFCKTSTKEYYFAEVKEDDQLTHNQIHLFPIIEKYLCPVIVIRVYKE